MTSLFDGVAGLLNDVFGGPVMHLPKVGEPVARHWIFREPQAEVQGDDGHVALDMAPHLRVPLTEAVLVSIGDKVTPPNGKTYRIFNRWPSGSPASDAFVIFGLEIVP